MVRLNIGWNLRISRSDLASLELSSTKEDDRMTEEIGLLAGSAAVLLTRLGLGADTLSLGR
jgi:hypothetical protein